MYVYAYASFFSKKKSCLIAQVWTNLRSKAACAASPRAAAALGERRHTHIQSRAASWDSSGGENVSRPGLRSCEPSGFRSNAWVCEFLTADHGVNACAESSRGFGSACKFLRIPAAGPGRSHTNGTRQILSTLCCQLLSARW